MLKLLVVTPNPTVYDATVRIVQTTKFDAEVIQTTSRQVVEDVSKAMEGCTGIVVARGNQAQLLKKCPPKLFLVILPGRKWRASSNRRAI